MTELQSDPRYEKLCNIMGITKESVLSIKKRDDNVAPNFSLHGLLQAEKAKQQIRKLGVLDAIQVRNTLNLYLFG